MRKMLAFLVALLLLAAALPPLVSATPTLPGTFIPDRYAIWELFLLSC